ncbi:hypothetical protein LXL04_036014 [Taraxacum kok-saghyz]
MSSTNPAEAEMAQQSSSKPPNIPDVENQNRNHNENQNQNQNHTTGYIAILPRWMHNQEIARKGFLALRCSGLVFSILANFIMPTSKTDDWFDWNAFDQYEELRLFYGSTHLPKVSYGFVITTLSLIYTFCQVWRECHVFSTGSWFIQNLALIDFVCDQIMAYLLISSASALVPLTTRMRKEGANNTFIGTLAVSISMEFFAFFVLGLSAIVSGYKLVKQIDASVAS